MKRTQAKISASVEVAAKQIQQEHAEYGERIAVNQSALILLGVEGAPANLVDIVAFYLSSGFAVQPHLSAYKQR